MGLSGLMARTKLSKERKLKPQEVACWQMRRAGHSIAEVAQYLGIGITTVKRYDNNVKAEFAEMPTVQAAKDHIMTIVPKATKAYEDLVSDKQAAPQRLAAARDILITHGIVRNKIEIEDSRLTDDELLKEAQRILSVANGEAKGQATQDQSGAGETEA